MQNIIEYYHCVQVIFLTIQYSSNNSKIYLRIVRECRERHSRVTWNRSRSFPSHHFSREFFIQFLGHCKWRKTRIFAYSHHWTLRHAYNILQNRPIVLLVCALHSHAHFNPVVFRFFRYTWGMHFPRNYRMVHFSETTFPLRPTAGRSSSIWYISKVAKNASNERYCIERTIVNRGLL